MPGVLDVIFLLRRLKAMPGELDVVLLFRRLKAMPGVLDVVFDVRNNPSPSCPLIVR